jgi:hypothetical protein
MRRVNLLEIQMMAKNCMQDIYTAAQGSDYNKPMIYLHWSAGHYGNPSEHYHINIDQGGEIYAGTDNLAEILGHTWHRNTGAIGVSALCCYNANSCDDLGPEPPTQTQIETMAQVVALLCQELGLPINYDYVRTHAEQADEDGYGPATTVERWDGWVFREGDEPGSGGNLIREKANWYLENGIGV